MFLRLLLSLVCLSYCCFGDVFLAGDATYSGPTDVLLTPSAQFKAGGIWHTEKITIRSGGNLVISGFTLRFLFRVAAPSSPPSDGIAVVLQNVASDAIGPNGGRMGVPENNRSGFMLDWYNSNSSSNAVNVKNIDDGSVLYSNVMTRYDTTWKSFEITYSHFGSPEVQMSIDGANPVHLAVNLFPEGVGLDSAWIGVTAGTGGYHQEHYITANMSYTLSTVGITTKPLTTKPLTTKELTTQFLTTKELTTKELTTQPLTTQPFTTKPLTTKPLTTQELSSQELTTQPLTTKPFTTKPLTTKLLTTQDLTTQPLTTKPLTTQELSTQELTTQPMTTKPLTTTAITSGEAETATSSSSATSGDANGTSTDETTGINNDQSSSSSGGQKSVSVMIGGVVGGLAAMIILAMFLVLYFKRRRPKRLDLPRESLRNSSTEVSVALQQVTSSEIKEVKIGERIGNGNFGEVYKGIAWGSTPVALKKIIGDDTDALLAEAGMLTKIKHPNCVLFLGIFNDGSCPYIVTEFCKHGSLLQYFSNFASKMDLEALQSIAFDAAKGMAYLEMNHVIHRDLAARNLLVDTNGTVKVADFGLSKSLDNPYYKVDRNQQFPVRWSAPEVINSLRYSSKSDVWAMGITLYEIFTVGILPYRGFTNSQVITMVIDEKYRMSQPKNIPDHIWNLISECLQENPENRPTMTEIASKLSDMLHKGTDAEKAPENIDPTQSQYYTVVVPGQPYIHTPATAN